MALACAPAAAGTNDYPWVLDRRDGTYRNPVLYSDYSDPDVVRDGADFYLVSSSFSFTPGLPILHSKDLVNWTIINHALKNLPDPRYANVQLGQGVWAPSLRKQAGKLWIFFATPDEGIYVTTATDPRGQWSKPHLVQPGKGLIDPCPLWDTDGKAYLVHAYAYSRARIKNVLRVRPMAPDGTKLLGEGKIVFTDPLRHPTIEGPKFHKWNGYYYISAPAGGVEKRWQVMLRSRNVYGPYEPKVVLGQGITSVNGPHQGAIVDTAAGEWWFVHFQDAGLYGRITHLQPMRWSNGWPVIGQDFDRDGIGEPVMRNAKPKVSTTVPVGMPQASDEFNAAPLGLQWQWLANHKDEWRSLTTKAGVLRLRAVTSGNNIAGTANLLTQKLPARAFTVETQMRLGPSGPATQAGLVVMGSSHAALVLQRPNLVLLVNNEPVVKVALKGSVVKLRVQMREGGSCAFSYALPDQPLKTIGGRFQATKSIWTGATVGVFCRAVNVTDAAGYADVHYFRFSPPPTTP